MQSNTSRCKPIHILSSATITRFESCFHKNSDDECWPWISYFDGRGYGMFRIGKQQFRAHRISYEIYQGKIPGGKLVRHKCDNKSCVNPNHLEPGTDADNSHDMVLRNRSTKGEINPMSKITENDVRDIVKLRASGMTQKEVGNIFGVTRANVSCIDRGISWAQTSGMTKQTSKQTIRATKELAREIYEYRLCNKMSLSKLAQKFNLSKAIIHAILSKKTWRNATADLPEI